MLTIIKWILRLVKFLSELFLSEGSLLRDTQARLIHWKISYNAILNGEKGQDKRISE